MLPDRQAIFFKRLLWAAVLGWAGLIFYMSTQNAGASNTLSGGITRSIASAFPPFRNMSEPAQLALVASLHVVVRKAAHCFLYFVLGILGSRLAFCYALSQRARVSLVLGIGFLYALSDELHQSFVPGRSGQPTDILIDFCGLLTGTLLTFGLLSLRRRKRKPSGFSAI